MKLGRETLKAGWFQWDCCYAVGFYNRLPTALLSAAATSLSPPSHIPLCLPRASFGLPSFANIAVFASCSPHTGRIQVRMQSSARRAAW